MINNPSSQFDVEMSKDASNVKIVFDYLDNKQGAVIQIIHTGKNSNDIQVKGDMKGTKLRIYVSKREFVLSIITWTITILALAIGFIAYRLAEGFNGYARIGIALGVHGLSLTVLGFASVWIAKKWSDQLPSDFKDFG